MRGKRGWTKGYCLGLHLCRLARTLEFQMMRSNPSRPTCEARYERRALPSHDELPVRRICLEGRQGNFMRSDSPQADQVLHGDCEVGWAMIVGKTLRIKFSEL